MKSQSVRLHVPALACLAFSCLLVARPAEGGYFSDHSVQSFYEDFNQFRGDGFIQLPGGTQLDSDLWRVSGLSDAEGLFGGAYLSGDWARGAATGAVTTGGVYAFQVGAELNKNWAIGFQSTASDLTPGALTLRVVNSTAETVRSVDIGFQVLFRNNAGRSTALAIDYGFDDLAYLNAFDEGWVSKADPENASEWLSNTFYQTVTGFSLLPSETFYLRWSMDDFGGIGSRDEIAIDDVHLNFSAVSSSVPTPSAVGSLLLIIGSLGWRRNPFGVSRGC